MIDAFTPLFRIFFGFILILYFFCIVFIFAGIVFWILMLVDVAKRNFTKKDDKIIWVLIVALLGVIGALIYYFVVKRKAKAKKRQVRKKR